ncbi:helix-turn-helix domain-containing protein [Nocardiopsis algeriensis]|uniref:helix-turn-helix domain-containing protein n=1 Tax=Nocardiopsis algeriensis TaxID=1478215 RepID=UPI003B43C510
MELREEQHSFGHLLRRYRLRREMTQQELADFSTISVRAIRDLEHGRARNPRRDTVRLLADGLRLGDRDREDLRAAAGRGPGRNRLRAGAPGSAGAPPAARTPFVGRQDELHFLTSRISASEDRLFSVVGAPGAGKTRFALEASARLQRDLGLRVVWSSADLLRAPGSQEPPPGAPGEEGHGQEAPDPVAASVGEEAALLVLDGPGTARPDPGPVEALLEAHPRLRVLTTARCPYGTVDEQVFLLEPPGAGDASEILRHHLHRADPLAQVDDARAERICALLDRLPGALAAVATWSAVYDPASLLFLLEEDPLPLLTPLGDAGAEARGADTRTALASAIADCPEEQHLLLRELCDAGGGATAASLAGARGISMADCGRALAGLMTRGLVLRDRRSAESLFHPLRLADVLVRELDTADDRMEIAS